MSAEKFIASNWRALQRNTLQGFVSLTLPSGLIIHECSVHVKDGKTWLAMPARKYEKNGEAAWSKCVEFVDREASTAFQELALQAIDALSDELSCRGGE